MVLERGGGFVQPTLVALDTKTSGCKPHLGGRWEVEIRSHLLDHLCGGTDRDNIGPSKEDYNLRNKRREVVSGLRTQCSVNYLQ